MKRLYAIILMLTLTLALLLTGCGAWVDLMTDLTGEAPGEANEPTLMPTATPTPTGSGNDGSAASEPSGETPTQAATLTPTPEPPPTGSGFTFPYSFSATDLYGNAVTEKSLGEKDVYFVHLWATWCPPCLAEMPDFPELMAAYGDRVGFIALLTDYDDNLSGAIKIVEDAGIPDAFIMVNGYDPSVARIYDLLQSGYVPTTVLISQDGVSEQLVGAYGMGYGDYLDALLD